MVIQSTGWFNCQIDTKIAFLFKWKCLSNTRKSQAFLWSFDFSWDISEAMVTFTDSLLTRFHNSCSLLFNKHSTSKCQEDLTARQHTADHTPWIYSYRTCCDRMGQPAFSSTKPTISLHLQSGSKVHVSVTVVCVTPQTIFPILSPTGDYEA